MHRRALLPLVLGAALALTACGSGDSDAAVAVGTATGHLDTWTPPAPRTNDPAPTSMPPLPPAPTDIITAAPPSSRPVATSATSSASSDGCQLPHTGDLMLWEKWPGMPVQVSMIGDVDYSQCKYSWETLADTEPSGPGYCDILARPSDNPGYNMNAMPPPRPKNILAQAGAGC